MPLEDGRPRLKLSYISAPFVLGNPLPPFLDVDKGRPFGDVIPDDELVFNGGLVGDVFTVRPKEEVLAYILETFPFG